MLQFVVLVAVFAVILTIPADLLARALRRKRSLMEKPTWPYGLALGLALVASTIAGPHVSAFLDKAYPERQVAELLADLGAETPAYAALRTSAPEVHRDIEAIVAEGVKRGDTREAIFGLARERIVAFITQMTPYLPDRQIDEALDITIIQARQLAKSNPQMCVDMLQGRRFGDARPYLSPGIQGREAAALLELIVVPKLENPPTMTEEQMTDTLRLVMIDAEKRTDFTIDEFGKIGTGALTPERDCIVTMEFLSSLRSLPAEKRGPLWRALNAGPGKNLR